MGDKQHESNRNFLKDTIRLQVDFSKTGQSLGLSPPPKQKPYPEGLPLIELPDGKELSLRFGSLSVGEAIAKRTSVRRYSQKPLSLEELGFLLWATQGVRKVLNEATALRTVPSAGARHPFETYLSVMRVGGLAPGMYRYLPFDGRLVQLRPDNGIGEKAASACLDQDFAARAAVTFFWTATPARTEWRYAAASYKVIAVDAGHVCQNLYLAGESIGAGVCAMAAYDQEKCDDLLGVDGEEEFTVYIAAVGKKR